jgi:hypothetical protein
MILLYGVLLLAWPAVPVQDAQLWLYEGELLGAVWRGAAAHGCQVVHALPPNALSQLLTAALARWLDPELVGRVYMWLCSSLFAAGLVYLCRVRAPAGRSIAVCACLPLCAGYPLFHGFLNYQAALPLLCWGMAFLLRDPRADKRQSAVWLTLWPSLLYLCHGTALLVWSLLVFVQLCIVRSSRLLVLAAIGFMPVLALSLAYVGQRTSEGANVTWSAGHLGTTVAYRLRSPLRFFSVFQGLTPTFEDASLRALAPLLIAVNVLYALTLMLGGLYWAWRTRGSRDPAERFLAWSTLALALAFVLLPHDLARMLNPGERLLIPMACLIAAGLSRFEAPRLRPVAYALLGAQSLYMAWFGTSAAATSLAVARARVGAGPQVRVMQARELAGDLPPPAAGIANLLTRHEVLAMQGLVASTRAGAHVTPFATGFFRCPADAAAHGGGDVRTLDGLRKARTPLLLLGDSAQVGAIATQLAPALAVTEAGSGYALLQPTAESR